MIKYLFKGIHLEDDIICDLVHLATTSQWVLPKNTNPVTYSIPTVVTTHNNKQSEDNARMTILSLKIRKETAIRTIKK